MMKQLISVSTKTGDNGTSGLANGRRVGKDNFIFEVLGSQDELNSWLGVCAAKLTDQFATERAFLYQVQEALFYLGAELAESPKAKLQQQALETLEQHSEALQAQMEADWTSKFLYPGGNQVAAWLDVARTVSRRFERCVVKYNHEVPVSPLVLQYVNRLSDYLYVLRCFVNSKEHVTERQFQAKSNP